MRVLRGAGHTKCMPGSQGQALTWWITCTVSESSSPARRADERTNHVQCEQLRPTWQLIDAARYGPLLTVITKPLLPKPIANDHTQGKVQHSCRHARRGRCTLSRRHTQGGADALWADGRAHFP